MDFLPYSQEYMLIVSIMGGMLLGFIWDIYRLIRHYTKFGRLMTAVGDVMYWIISVFFSITVINDISYGNVRLFILLGFTFGAIIYFYGISNYILKVFISMIDFIIYILKKFIAFMIYPVKYVIKKLKQVLYPFIEILKKEREKANRKYKFFKFRVKKVFKNKKMLYNKKRRSRKKNKKKSSNKKKSF